MKPDELLLGILILISGVSEMQPLNRIAVTLSLVAILAGCFDDPETSSARDGAAEGEAPLSSGAPSPMPSPAPADSSRLSLDWMGTYSGIVPCASCPGVETSITLNEDGTFERSMRHINESPFPVIDSGTFSWNDAGSIVTLTHNQGETQQYQVGEFRLFQLDRQGRRIEGDLASYYNLDQHLSDPRLEDRRWVLTELLGASIETAETQHQVFLLLSSEASSAHGNASCNSFTGSYAIKSGMRIEFAENITMTLMACPNMVIEQAFMGMLATVDNYSLADDGSMTLNRARMAPLARFVQASESE